MIYLQTFWGNVSEKRPSMKECVSSLMDYSSQCSTNRYKDRHAQTARTQSVLSQNVCTSLIGNVIGHEKKAVLVYDRWVYE